MVGLSRSGAQSASVTASFEVASHHPTNDWLREHDLSDGEFADFAACSIRRTGAQRPSSMTALYRPRFFASSGGHLWKSTVSMTTAPSSIHRRTAICSICSAGWCRKLGRFGALGGVAGAKQARGPRKALELAQREADYLQASCDELDTLAPQDGEEEALAAKRQAILSSAKFREDLETAADALSGPSFPMQSSCGAAQA